MPLSSRVAVHTSQLVDEQVVDYGRACLVNEVRLLFDKQDSIFKLQVLVYGIVSDSEKVLLNARVLDEHAFNHLTH